MPIEGLDRPRRQTGPEPPSGGPPPGSVEVWPGNWYYPNPLTGYMEIWKQDLDPVTGETLSTYSQTDAFKMPGEAGDSAEQARHNRASEALGLRQIALEQAKAALSGYMDALSEIRQGRQGAISEARALLPMLVEPGKEFFSGFEPSGFLGGFAKEFGLPGFEPVRIQHKQLQPGTIAQQGPISPEIAALLEGIRSV